MILENTKTVFRTIGKVQFDLYLHQGFNFRLLQSHYYKQFVAFIISYLLHFKMCLIRIASIPKMDVYFTKGPLQKIQRFFYAKDLGVQIIYIFDVLYMENKIT